MPRQPTRAHALLTLLLLAITLVPKASAQTQPDPHHVDASTYGEPLVLGHNWLFSPGDNPAWSSPAFDDSTWPTISSERSLASYNLHNVRVGWYRTHIQLRPGLSHLSIGVLDVHGSYTLYANGVKIGAAGSSGMVRYTQIGPVPWAIPDRLIGPEHQLTLAIRFAFNATGTLGKGTSTPLDAMSEIYLIDSQTAAHEVSYFDTHNTADSFVLACLGLLVGAVALALFGAMRTRYEYLAAAIALLSSCFLQCTIIWERTEASTLSVYVIRSIFLAVSNIALIEFVRMIVRHRRAHWLSVLEAISFVTSFSTLLAILGYGPLYLAFFSFFLPLLLVNGVLIILLATSSFQHNLEARVLLPAALLLAFARLWDFVRLTLFFTHSAASISRLPELTLATFHFDLFSIANFLFYTTILLFLVLRTVNIARERARIGAELEAARTTQQFLMSRDTHPTPGFEVQTVYYPASEVGGDFFLVSPSHQGLTADGSLIVIVGDVSGKGLKAAMRVAMILGVLRREDTRQPSVILHNLNTALHNDGSDGFTTACCIRLSPDGHCTIANAGHIAPYLNGREIETPPALPLGLAPHQTYESIDGYLPENQTIVLLSDGVLEAQSPSGELLGFARLAQLTTQSANTIAETARNFGQEDDITVLTVTRPTSPH